MPRKRHHIRPSDDGAKYIPTEDAIELGKLEVQKKWSASERERRAGRGTKPQPFRVKVCSVSPDLTDQERYMDGYDL